MTINHGPYNTVTEDNMNQYNNDTHWDNQNIKIVVEHCHTQRAGDEGPLPSFQEDLDKLRQFHEAERIRQRLTRQYTAMRAEAEAAKDRVAATVRQVEFNIAASSKEKDGRGYVPTPGDLRHTEESRSYDFIDLLPVPGGGSRAQPEQLKRYKAVANLAQFPEAAPGQERLETTELSRPQNTQVKVTVQQQPTLCPNVGGCRSWVLRFIRTRKGLLLATLILSVIALLVFTLSADLIMEIEIGSTIQSGHKALKDLINKTKE